MTPVYPTTKGVSQGRLRALLEQLDAVAWPDDATTPYQTLLYLHHPPADATEDEISAAQEQIARVGQHDRAVAGRIERRPQNDAAGGHLPGDVHLDPVTAGQFARPFDIGDGDRPADPVTERRRGRLADNLVG